MATIHDQGRTIVTLKDHAWGERRKPRPGGNPLRPIPRDGIEYTVQNPSDPTDPSKVFKRRRSRSLHFVGSEGFPEGLWIGETQYLSEAEHGPPWIEKTVLDVEPEQYHHLTAISKGTSHLWMSWTDRQKDARAKMRLRADVAKYGNVAAEKLEMGSMQEQIAKAVAEALVAEREKPKIEREKKRLAAERAKRTKNEKDAHEVEIVVNAEAGR